MILIEIKHTDDSPVEIINLVIDTYNEEILSEGNNVLFFISSDREDFKELKTIINDKFNICFENIFYFGLQLYSDIELALLRTLVLFRYDIEFIDLLVPLDKLYKGVKIEDIMTDNYCLYVLNLIKLNSNEYKPYELKENLILFKKWLRSNISYDVYTPLINPINIAIELCAIETQLVFKEDTISIDQLITQLEKDSYKATNFNHLLESYKKLVERIEPLSIEHSIKKRVKYLNQAVGYSGNFDNSIASRRTPWLILWFVSLFLLRSKIYKSRNDNSASLAMCIRALELYSKASLISGTERSGAYIDCGFISTLDRFYLGENYSGKKKLVSGVGPLWKKVKGLNVISRNTSCLDSLIKCRNKSTFGHGLSSCNASITETSYNELIETIKNTSFYSQPSLRLGRTQWEVLLDCAMHNPLVGTTQLIGTMGIASLANQRQLRLT